MPAEIIFYGLDEHGSEILDGLEKETGQESEQLGDKGRSYARPGPSDPDLRRGRERSG
jgi:hypothetical protein